jgi:hypothetical protein
MPVLILYMYSPFVSKLSTMLLAERRKLVWYLKSGKCE